LAQVLTGDVSGHGAGRRSPGAGRRSPGAGHHDRDRWRTSGAGRAASSPALGRPRPSLHVPRQGARPARRSSASRRRRCPAKWCSCSCVRRRFRQKSKTKHARAGGLRHFDAPEHPDAGRPRQKMVESPRRAERSAANMLRSRASTAVPCHGQGRGKIHGVALPPAAPLSSAPRLSPK
jgi:hypothetical protein